MDGWMFEALSNYEIDSTPVAEKRYKWIARVVHSRNYNYPHMCTAVCIDTRIFITAAACISTLKVVQTSIIYQYGRLHAIAFVVPSNGSQQAFDDIGFIIVVKDNAMKWRTIGLFDTVNRTDDNFEWFAQIFNNDEIEHKVVGYTVPKIIHHLVIPDKQFYLTELPVVVNINLCPSILTFNNLISGFYSPCYHSCSVPDYEMGAKSCASYHGVEGAAVFNVASNKLLGVATWGPTNMKPLPVGFAVPNSENFFEDYNCAKRIRDDKSNHESGYQKLCD
ncbi:hypothetical protein RR46_01801 [Papilio xuthus]|uniref:Peptidase S1 domain-containing protein n=1 Tax=Papilio xuthus TaxID=66420 RepID=A0A194QH43_PAPXU|nr:hypothetical protein RR46_01801 [Papilio xuthus]